MIEENIRKRKLCKTKFSNLARLFRRKTLVNGLQAKYGY